MVMAGNGVTGVGAMEKGSWKSFVGKMRRLPGLVWDTAWKIGREDPRRVIHSVKVGLSLTLVSLLYLTDPLFQGFGNNAMWAVMTVVVVLEFTAGATLCKGLNRGLGTLLAGSLAFLIEAISDIPGKIFRAIFIGTAVFLIGATATYMRFIPHIKRNFDYGVIVFLLTFNLITVSSYRFDIIGMTSQRIYTIAIGCGICLLMSLLIFPNWSGEDLHNSTVSKLEGLARSIEACVNEYFDDAKTKISEDMNSSKDPINQDYKAVLDSKASDETLALYASWEPRHLRHCCRHQWHQYVKLGAVLRHFGYSAIALNGCLQSEIQTPQSIRALFRKPCSQVAGEVSRVLMELADSIRKRRRCRPEGVSDHLQEALQDLNTAIKSKPRLFFGSKHNQASNPVAAATASPKHDKDSGVHSPSMKTETSASDQSKVFAGKVLRRSSSKIAITSLEFSEALPFAAFASLLVEMVARLDLVIEEVEALGRLANFEEFKPGLCLSITINTPGTVSSVFLIKAMKMAMAGKGVTGEAALEKGGSKSFAGKLRRLPGLVWQTAWKVGREDPRRVIHSLKVGLSLTLVSLLYLTEPLFQGIGENAMWAVMTVVVVLEFTAGATLCKGLNRGLGTLCAGSLAFLIEYISEAGKIFHAIFIATAVFLIGATATYMRFIPHIKRNFDYGEDLHNSTLFKLEGLARSIEACVNEYFQDAETKVGEDNSPKDPLNQDYKAVLDSKSSDESLALYASWEPRKLRLCYRHPWQQYVKLGAVLRHFGYSAIALNGCLQSEIQILNMKVMTPRSIRALFSNPCIRVAGEVSKVLMELADSIRMCRKCYPERLSDHLQEALQDLNTAIKSQPRLFFGSKHNQASNMLPVTTATASPKCNKESGVHLQSTKTETSANNQSKESALKVLRPSLSKIAITSLEFSEALPFAAFASLLVEMVARLDLVIEEVEELGRLGNFKEFRPGDEIIVNCETPRTENIAYLQAHLPLNSTE
ncbi:hypothetical protein HHK36_028538 [Tetracentron sinense]|uniref:Integral membrane bound transporter domain-containing protein n=1 Tax=Tetracentron sinense TaxID=13715 RepID=A0A834YDK4_TETSI|nr:hypothetical protein HHK36_028538 [Tetracentron sinense]